MSAKVPAAPGAFATVGDVLRAKRLQAAGRDADVEWSRLEAIALAKVSRLLAVTQAKGERLDPARFAAPGQGQNMNPGQHGSRSGGVAS